MQRLCFSNAKTVNESFKGLAVVKISTECSDARVSVEYSNASASVGCKGVQT